MKNLTEKQRMGLKMEAMEHAMFHLQGSFIDENLLNRIEWNVLSYLIESQLLGRINTVPNVKCNAYLTYGDSVDITFSDPETGEIL